MEAANEQYEFIKSNQEVSKEELSSIAVKIEPKVEILETFDSIEEQIVHTVLRNVGDKDGEEVHVIYLNVDESAEPQVLDLGNLLGHEGIQVYMILFPFHSIYFNSFTFSVRTVCLDF